MAPENKPYHFNSGSGMKNSLFFAVFCLAFVNRLPAAEYPAPIQGDVTLRDFRFATGETLPEVRMHYRALGKPRLDDKGVVQNAVLILHGTGGEGGTFIRPEFAGELFGKDQLLDATQFYLIIPDNLGHGKSSKPSDGLRGKFPHYGYRDMIAAQHRMLTEGLKVNHLRLVIGTSMGGMHAWLWGQMHPDFMDGLVPLASLPTQISGFNRMWRKLVSDAIRNDCEWNDGNYTRQPKGLRIAAEMILLKSSNPVLTQKAAPTLKAADELFEKNIARFLTSRDANDLLYAIESSNDYDPAPGLEKIKAPLLAINFADDLINPPELGILEKEIKRVKNGKAIIIPLSDATVGHGTHTKASVWKNHLEAFLKEIK
jgi:homoserine O-acetyltransferase